ncbi:hypothetical protein [Halomarina oriensis]|uniref:ECF transporter S component n=1 Tax=Halomarina oriensis TaxID=671145 RepID=A0A6B0GP86_9EURY|nr:hypothetical protein [Halomarina oriensis]MWG34483.1 hypothetical protein [Halomarina oriensis]
MVPSSLPTDRLAALVLAVCAIVVYVLVDPFTFLADSVATSLTFVPVTFLLYALGVSKRTAFLASAGGALGLALGTFLQSAGVVG